MRIFNYEEFNLQESMKLEFSFLDDSGVEYFPEDFKKVQLLTDTYDLDQMYGFKFIATKSIFKPITIANLDELETGMPVLNFGTNPFIEKLLKEKRIFPENLYNKPQHKAISANKRKFHEVFDSAEFLPKTVFSIKEATKLNFPIIAKPSNGHSGIGIMKFMDKTELLAYETPEDFDLFSEAISIKSEIRLIYLENTLVSFMIREPRDTKSQFLQGKIDRIGKGKDAGSKLDFVYQICLPEEINLMFPSVEKMKAITDIVASIRKKVPLEFITIDFAIDTDEKIWVIEINTEPGSSGIMLTNLYRAIFELHYGRVMDVESTKFFKEVEMKLIQFTLLNDKYALSPKFVQKYINKD